MIDILCNKLLTTFISEIIQDRAINYYNGRLIKVVYGPSNGAIYAIIFSDLE